MNRYERRKAAIEQEQKNHVDAYKAIYAKADAEDREPSEQERLEVESHLQAIEVLGTEKKSVEENIKTLSAVDELGKSLGPAISSVDVISEPQDRVMRSVQKSLGEKFIDSPGFQKAIKTYREEGRLPQGFSTGIVSGDLKGTLGEGAGRGGTALVSIPDLVPGIVTTQFQKLTIADLLLSGQTTATSIRYVTEGTATSGAAGVAETGTKPESTLGFTTTDEPIRKIATVLPIAEELVEDAPAIRAYIDGRLTLFIQIEEERQLLRGATGGTEVQGLLTSRSIPVYAGGTAVGNKAIQVFKALNGFRGSAYVEPEWIAIHPTDYEDIRLLRDGTGGTQGQFYGGGPFMGPYGVGSQVSASNQVTGSSDTLWGKPVYVTNIVGAGTALIGSSSSAQVFRKGGISVDATNSHDDWFTKNMLAIRAEERLGLALYYPKGFCEIRLA